MLSQVEFEAFPPADEDYDGVRGLVNSLFKGQSLDTGLLSQCMIDNYKVTFATMIVVYCWFPECQIRDLKVFEMPK